MGAGTRARAALAGLALLAAVSWRSLAGEVVLVMVEGEELAGPLQAFDPVKGLTVADKTIKLDEVAELRVRGVPAIGAKDKAKVYLRSGDLLCAQIVLGNENILRVQSERTGAVDLRLDTILGIVFPIKEPPAEAVVAEFLGPKEKEAVEDQVLRPKGEVESGSMEKFSDRELFFVVGGQKRTYLLASPAEGQPGEAIAAFRFGVLKPYTPPGGFQAQAHLADGSKLSGELTSFADGGFALTHADGAKFSLPLGAIRRIGFRGGRLVFLSSLDPQAVEQKPLVGGAPVVFGWKRDAAVTGERLRIGRREYEHGVGVHSYSRLSYQLDGQFARLLVEVGLDNSASTGAVCSWEIVGDGQVLKSGAAKAGGPAEKLRVELKGVKQLELLCDYGTDNDDAGDHLDWADARLIR